MACYNNATALDKRNETRVRNFLNDRSRQSSVQQAPYDTGMLNDRTLKMDMIKEMKDPIKPMNEDEQYNFMVRRMLVEWLLNIVNHHQINIDTYALCISMFDKVMERLRPDLEQNSYQLISGTCLLMASKYLDTETLPSIRICEHSDRCFSETELLECERLVIAACRINGYLNLFVPTPVDIIPTLAFVTCDVGDFERVRSNAYLFYSLLASEKVFHGVLPSLVAGVLVYRSYCSLGKTENFTSDILHETHPLIIFRNSIIEKIKSERETFDRLVEEVENAYIQWLTNNDNSSPLRLPKFDVPQFPTQRTPTDVLSTSIVMDILH